METYCTENEKWRIQMVDDERRKTPAPPGGNDRSRMPLWVKVSCGVGLAVIVVFVLLHLTGNGMVGH